MAALTDSAQLLFQIRADNTSAVKGIKETERAIGGLTGATGTLAGGMLSVANPIDLASRAIVAVGAAAVGAAVATFALAKATSDLGSQLFDAQAKTGLTAATLSTLKFNADKAGSSFEQVSGSVAKFTVLLGQAQQGNEKAVETLAKYGITATDTNDALDQAITTIAAMETVEQRAAAARELFKDKSLSLLPVIEQLNGSLSEATKETIRTGQAMTEEGIRASDDFGDALTDLQAEVGAVGRLFAVEFMPSITAAMKAISESLVANKAVFSAWGVYVKDVMRGVQLYAAGMTTGLMSALSGISRAMGANEKATRSWAATLITEMAKIVASGGVLFYILSKIGAANPASSAAMGGEFNPGLAIPNLPSAGGRGGGGGGGGGGGASGPSELDKAKDANAEYLKDVKQTVTEALSENEKLFAEKERLEEDFIDEKNRLARFEILEEIRVTQELLNIRSISVDERKQIERELARLESQLRTEQNEQDKQAAEDRVDAIEQAAKEIVEWEEWLAKKRAEIRDRERKKANANAKTELSSSEKDQIKFNNQANLSILGDSVLSVRDDAGNLVNTIKPILPVLQLGGQALQQFAQGVGNVVQNLVLMGSAGPQAMKKLVASVLAGVSAQAAVISVMELAYGIAALTPWGLAIYGNPANHFKAAALMASVAVGTGLLGRGVAGDSFQNGGGSGGGSGSASDANNGNRPGLVFTTVFKGFEDKVAAAMDGVSDAVNRFNQKFGIASASDVVMAGAGGASSAIFNATLDAVQNDGSLAIEFQRKIGNY